MYPKQTDLLDIEKEIHDIKKQISKLPGGRLLCESNGNYSKHYHYVYDKDSKREIKEIIPSKKLNFAKDLALKQYLSYKLEDLSYIYSLLSKYVSRFSKHNFKAEKYLQKQHIRNLIISSLYGDDFNNFLSTDNPDSVSQLHTESLKFKSVSGNILRSKSELLIDQALFHNNLLYKYEYPLTLNSITLHPDFSIIRQSDNKLIVWEHFGMMDNPAYAQNALQKMNLYIANGFIPNVNLIITYETSDHPLDNQQIDTSLRILQG
ncbi:MAG: hypothetical protein MJ104_07580 [Lachnospiraceae bacterium]|nr:hypothetical protein [Lachnospiraceae bacterium]